MIAAGQWLASRARISAAHPALEIAGEAISYGELQRRARSAAGRLRALGVGPGDVVATLLGNGAPFAELLHAAALGGAVLLPLNVRLTPRELARQLRDAGADLLLHGGGELEQRASAAANAAGTPTRATAGAARRS